MLISNCLTVYFPKAGDEQIGASHKTHVSIAARIVHKGHSLFPSFRRVDVVFFVEDRPVKSRILMVSVGPLYGGGETYYVKLAKILAERYDLAALIVDRKLCDQLRAIGITTWKVGGKKPVRSISRYPGIAISLGRAIREFKPAVVHLNGQGESYLAPICWLLGVPAIATRHTSFDKFISAFKRYLVIGSLRPVKKIVCVSSVLMRQLADVMDRTRLVVIPNWIDPMPQALPYLPPRPGEVFRLLYVGRLIREKGVFDLIEAVRQLDNVSLSVVGEGADAAEASVCASGLPITFHGFQADCSPFYRDAHLLVFPSSPALEGHPQVPIEAMAHSLPSLIGNIPVNCDTADQGRAAELFQWGDVGDLASKIEMLQCNPQRLSSLSGSGLEHVHCLYTKERVRDQYFEVFDGVIAEQSRKKPWERT
jgi:glycosyltransferase involved in cell wall biosynthesis